MLTKRLQLAPLVYHPFNRIDTAIEASEREQGCQSVGMRHVAISVQTEEWIDNAAGAGQEEPNWGYQNFVAEKK